MELSPQDSLRLNVLLASQPLAIRIDESAMCVYGLTEAGEARVRLNPLGRHETYLRRVRELFSGQVLGSPGGYPVYLQRWTRMGQMRDESLAQLLLLGEPEAVVAAVCAPGLTAELARRAWWAMPDAHNARRMLANPRVAEDLLGRELAAFLIEYLPFETEAEAMIETIRLVLQPGLLTEKAKQDLWNKARHKNIFYVGFLSSIPDALPLTRPARADMVALQSQLEPLAQGGNPIAALLEKLLSASGQTYLETLIRVLATPSTQEMVTTTLELIGTHFRSLRPEGDPGLSLSELQGEAADFARHSPLPQVEEIRTLAEGSMLAELQAMRLLSGLGYGVIRPVLKESTATGSLMRRKLEPVLTPIIQQLEILRGPQARSG